MPLEPFPRTPQAGLRFSSKTGVTAVAELCSGSCSVLNGLCLWACSASVAYTSRFVGT